MQSKQLLRSAILKKRLRLTTGERNYAARAITTRVLNSEIFRRSQHVAFYLPVKGEVNTLTLLQKTLRMRKHCFLPVLHPLKHNFLWFYQYKKNDPLVKNRYGILEPKINFRKKWLAKNLNLVFTPLVAFDEKGNRLGSGKGYYDRTFGFLKNSDTFNVKLVGLAYEFQKMPEIPLQAWDIPLHSVVTEKKFYKNHNFCFGK